MNVFSGTERGASVTGILTFHKSINYGSVLQAWALQEALRKNGVETEIIDYEPKAYARMYHVFSGEMTVNIAKRNVKRIPIARSISRQNRLFAEFRQNRLRLSREKLTWASDTEKSLAKYDTIICGSDQIWNIHARDCDPIYFLPSGYNGKKIAYAVSVNSVGEAEMQSSQRIREAVEGFDFLSFREASGARKAQTCSRRTDIATALDPTMLLEKEDFEKIASPRIIPGEYIFLYNVWFSRDAAAAAEKLAETTRMPVYAAFTNRDSEALFRMKRKGITVLTEHSAPEDFLSLMAHASLVITDSFHGTAFSILFERPFFAINETDSNGRRKNDERITHILEAVGLPERYVPLRELTDAETFRTDYSGPGETRRRLAEESVAWLKNALKQGKEG